MFSQLTFNYIGTNTIVTGKYAYKEIKGGIVTLESEHTFLVD